MLKNVKRKLTGLAVVAALSLLPGCASKFESRNEKIETTSSIRHEIYGDSQRKRIESALDTVITADALGGRTFEMKVYGKDRELLWRYCISPESILSKTYKTEIYDSKNKLIKRFYRIPEWLPCQVQFRSTSEPDSEVKEHISYYNMHSESIDPTKLDDINPAERN
jgi:hypothetical protein